MNRARAITSVGVAAVTLLSGCLSDTSTAGPTNDPAINELIAQGYRRDMIVDQGEYFLVEGDIMISKKSLAEGLENPQRIRPDFQWRATTIVDSRAQNIRVNLTGLASQPAWQTAARQAILEWNRIGCANVQLTEGSPAHITFSTFSGGSSGLAAQALLPQGGAPGTSVQVNLSYTVTPNNSSTKKQVMAHEIGHTLGLRHTNYKSLGESSANHVQVPGTPPTDSRSVMNGGDPRVAWTEFSFYDIVAAKTLYPGGFCPNLSGPTQVRPYVACSWTASPSGGTPPYQYSWFGGAFGSATTYLYGNSGQGFLIWGAVRDNAGRIKNMKLGVNVYQYGPTCG